VGMVTRAAGRPPSYSVRYRANAESLPPDHEQATGLPAVTAARNAPFSRRVSALLSVERSADRTLI